MTEPLKETRRFAQDGVIEVEVTYGMVMPLAEIIEKYSRFHDVLIAATYDGEIDICYNILKDSE